jgi:prolyl-tRNA editing enzyme YbaK/EbsC (Cys-tRNA(Pro) deacylase)
MSLVKVKEYFKKYNIEDKIMEFNTSSATVSLAATTIGCTPNEIAKSLAFTVKAKSVIIVMAGDSKIDNAKYRKEFNTKARMIDKEQLNKLIGHEVGGICPFALNDNVLVYLDNSLKKFKYVYPACGSSNSAIKLSILELEKYSNYVKWIDVCKDVE